MAGVAAEGRYDSEGDEEEQVRGWGSVGSNSNELMEEYEAYGGGTGGSDEEGLVEEWSGSDGSDEVVAAREGSSGDGMSGEVVMMMWEEDLMEEMRADWEEIMGDGGEWEQLQGSDASLCSWEHSAMTHLQREYEGLRDEYLMMMRW